MHSFISLITEFIVADVPFRITERKLLNDEDNYKLLKDNYKLLQDNYELRKDNY